MELSTTLKICKTEKSYGNNTEHNTENYQFVNQEENRN